MALIKGRIKKEKRKTPSERLRGRKRVERTAARSFKDKLLARAKLFGKKTKLSELMRTYNKFQKNWKGKVKLSLLADNMIVHVENPKETVNSRSVDSY